MLTSLFMSGPSGPGIPFEEYLLYFFFLKFSDVNDCIVQVQARGRRHYSWPSY